MTKSESITKLSAALAKAQAEFKPVAFDCENKFLKNKYATLGAVIQSTRTVLAKHGLAVSQVPTSGEKTIGVETILAHESGEFISSTICLPLGDEKGKSQAQVAGSILTYLRRYSLSGILGIYADEDTDGEHTQREPVKSTAEPAKPAAPVKATEKHRAAMIQRLMNNGISSKEIQEFAVKSSIILSTEQADMDWPLDKCPTNPEQMAKILADVKSFVDGGDVIP